MNKTVHHEGSIDELMDKDGGTSVSLEDYPIEVLEAALRILRAQRAGRSGQNGNREN